MTVVQGNRPTRRRGTCLGISLMLALALLSGLAAAVWLTEDRAPCVPAAAAAFRPALAATPSIAPGGVTVSVLNSTDRSGLASTVASALRARGFAIAEVANTTPGRVTKSPAEVRHGRQGLAAAAAVARFVPGAVLRQDRRTGSRVDLILGPSFTQVTDPPGRPTATPPLVRPTPGPVLPPPATC